ncbi:MAG: type I methionyl aminopeptidase [Lentisphaerae bacterium]|nr:type I methionyl aminopeptidase [Lentisphaerota bacterium]MBR2720648.1 type I methionyl aminopeptidase [Lentisphaeria bacterium]
MSGKRIIHTPEEIKRIRRAAEVTAGVRDEIARLAHPGMTTFDLDQLAGTLINASGGRSAFKNYHGYPGYICISVNDVVVHGIGRPDQIITEDDIVSIDVGVNIDNAIGDTALTFGFKEPSSDVKRLLEGTRQALMDGIAAARRGAYVRDISAAVEKCARRNKLGVVREYVGHGCGIQLHEPPEVPNYTGFGKGARLEPGMVLCIEPMLNLGTDSVKLDRKDNWTVRTADGSLSAHFEHMILITENEPEVLTWQKTM